MRRTCFIFLSQILFNHIGLHFRMWYLRTRSYPSTSWMRLTASIRVWRLWARRVAVSWRRISTCSTCCRRTPTTWPSSSLRCRRARPPSSWSPSSWRSTTTHPIIARNTCCLSSSRPLSPRKYCKKSSVIIFYIYLLFPRWIARILL